MADEYDKEAALLVCVVDFPTDKTRDRVAAALREAGKRESELRHRIGDWIAANSPGGWIDDLRREVEKLKKTVKDKYDESAFLESELVEKDAEIAALKESTSVVLISRLRNQYDEQVEWNNNLRAEIAALKAKLAEVEKSATAFQELNDLYHRHQITGPNGECSCPACNLHHIYGKKLAEADKRGMERSAMVARTFAGLDFAGATVEKAIRAEMEKVKP